MDLHTVEREYNGGMTISMRAALFGGLLLVLPIIAFAAEFRTGDQPSLSSGQVVNNDLYLAGGSVNSSGSVQGDLTVAGGTILVNGPVSADLMAGGGSVTILGDIAGDVRFGGGNIVVQGAVLGDVIGGGGQVTVSGSKVGGDVAIGGGMVTIDAPISGTVHIGGGTVRINAPIAGNVFVKADKLTLGPKAALNGNLTYSAEEAATMENGALVKGETRFEEREIRGAGKAALAAFFTLWLVAKLLMSLVGAFLIAYFFHRYSRELVATAAMQPWMEIGRGLIFLIVVPVVSAILFASIIGIPLGAIALLAYILTMIFVCLAAPIVTGSIVHKWIWKPAGYVVDWKSILIGVVIYFLLGLIPFVGWIVKLGIILLTLGAALNIKWSVAKEWR